MSTKMQLLVRSAIGVPGSGDIIVEMGLLDGYHRSADIREMNVWNSAG